jgi:hypothetical protein
MAERIIAALMLVVAVIHLLPVIGFSGADKLTSLYGIEMSDGNLEILMRHRAILFGILGSFFVYAAFTPALQPLAFIAAFVSLASFFYLSLSVGDFSDSIRKIVIGDVVAAVCLLASIVLYFVKNEA